MANRLAAPLNFTEAEIDLALALFCGGRDTAMIAQQFGCAEAAIYNALPKWRAQRRSAA